ncbi:G2/M phase-specific E3 ubiquitin-protein ligase-like [Pecten maximus]|uniref:G2/M phase-specific E3 ubiquitin-protein ligase-like n=1 Tax=Pecten maximus TaxID=6579 RepID=UPI0014583753|nr:G2/M phase-specific E3 ubiquitin-protein ligase-like [Pecten maximus]
MCLLHFRVQSEFVQFRNGLNKVGRLLDAVQLAPKSFLQLFTQTSKALRFRDIRELYKVNWSPDGSNNKRQEEQALYCLEAFLADSEGGSTGISLDKVLSFWTGAASIPPLGFEKSLDVSFGSTKQFPTAHTCALILTIWRGFDDPDEFQDTITKAIKWAGEFIGSLLLPSSKIDVKCSFISSVHP